MKWCGIDAERKGAAEHSFTSDETHLQASPSPGRNHHRDKPDLRKVDVSDRRVGLREDPAELKLDQVALLDERSDIPCRQASKESIDRDWVAVSRA